MADDAQWIDEAAQQQIEPIDIPPEGSTDPRAVEQRMREIQLYNQIMGKGVPKPRPRPPEADNIDANDDWGRLTEKQKQQRRAGEIKLYNDIMRRRK